MFWTSLSILSGYTVFWVALYIEAVAGLSHRRYEKYIWDLFQKRYALWIGPYGKLFKRQALDIVHGLTHYHILCSWNYSPEILALYFLLQNNLKRNTAAFCAFCAVGSIFKPISQILRVIILAFCWQIKTSFRELA